MRTLYLHQVGKFRRTNVGDEENEGFSGAKRSEFGGQFVMRE